LAMLLEIPISPIYKNSELRVGHGQKGGPMILRKIGR
jgi:hypothetical protein